MAIRRSATKRNGLPTIVQLRLTPTPAQAEALAAAVQVCNEAATVVSGLAWQHRVFAVVELHRLAYYEVRAQVAGLGAQAAVRAIARVAGAYANRRASKKRAHLLFQLISRASYGTATLRMRRKHTQRATLVSHRTGMNPEMSADFLVW